MSQYLDAKVNKQIAFRDVFIGKGGQRPSPEFERDSSWGPYAATQMNELAGQSLGGYLLEEEIGRGSMGMVYRGKQIALGREVAIKVLPRALAKDASYVARFIREARIIAGLNHPNIVQIYDAGQQGGLLYFVMEYIQGPTIGSLLLIDGSMPQYIAADYSAQIADALDSAYKERNVIHRDIKPENLMLDRWGKIKVMDFGLARAPGQLQITLAKTLVGSIYYASPEQVWGQPLDNRSDIYALGAVLYEMVNGHRPFNGRTLPELTQAIVGGNLRPPSTFNPEISKELEQIILTAMARNRDERYDHAGLMAQNLRTLNLKPSPVTATRDPHSPSTANQRGSRESIVIHPPKRPQAQRPRYLDLDATQPPPGESREQSPGVPAHEQSPTQGKTANTAYQDEVPTKPLGPIKNLDSLTQQQIEQSPLSSNPEARRTLWRQLQRIFKSNAT